jgi:hypothetical protein
LTGTDLVQVKCSWKDFWPSRQCFPRRSGKTKGPARTTGDDQMKASSTKFAALVVLVAVVMVGGGCSVGREGITIRNPLPELRGAGPTARASNTDMRWEVPVGAFLLPGNVSPSQLGTVFPVDDGEEILVVRVYKLPTTGITSTNSGNTAGGGGRLNANAFTGQFGGGRRTPTGIIGSVGSGIDLGTRANANSSTTTAVASGTRGRTEFGCDVAQTDSGRWEVDLATCKPPAQGFQQSASR